MISRKALLVSAPIKGESYSPGSNSDLETTRNFLLSPRGGGWFNDEITVLDNPTVDEIITVVKEMNADYTITYFSGKTFSDRNGNRFLVLNGDFIQDTELLNQSGKQLVLVDICADTFTEEVIHFVGRPNEFELARRMYDKWIERCEPGQMIMHATEKTDRPESKKGVFTQKLLQLASRVPAVENRFNLKSILAAGHEMPELLTEEGEYGGPEITYTNGNVKLPFAMALPAKKTGSNTSDPFTGIALGIFLLGLFLSSE